MSDEKRFRWLDKWSGEAGLSADDDPDWLWVIDNQTGVVYSAHCDGGTGCIVDELNEAAGAGDLP